MARESSSGQVDGAAVSGTSRREAMRAAARNPAKALRAVTCLSGDRVMPPVFVSYARDDIAVAAELVHYLRERGVAVTWDQDLPAGTDFERSIRKTIDEAPTVIVVWSASSSASAFVRDEARRALQAAKLVTTHVDGFNFSDVPLGFGHLHAIPVDDRQRLAKSLAEHGVKVGPEPGRA